MAIIGALPVTLTNGTLADATQVMSDFNFIVSQVNANAAASGVNSDITSLTGLVTPLSVAQGGTGTMAPSLVGGSNVVISGTWPNQTVTVAGIGTGTVTSITAGTGLTGGTITSSGTIALDIPVAIANGGTNATTAAAALTNLGGVSLTAANTFTAAQIISLTGATTNLSLVSTDAGAGAGPILVLDRQSASPAASDGIGMIQFLGKSSTGVARTYAQFDSTILSPTNTAENGDFHLATLRAGSLADRIIVGLGLYTAGASGGDKGANTINATTLYQGGTAISSLFQATITKYDSGDQTISAGGALTLTHSLGGTPNTVLALLHCITGELGYTAGDFVVINPSAANSGANQGVSIVITTTQVVVRFGSAGTVFGLFRKDTGAYGNITLANWAFVIRAQRFP